MVKRDRNDNWVLCLPVEEEEDTTPEKRVVCILFPFRQEGKVGYVADGIHPDGTPSPDGIGGALGWFSSMEELDEILARPPRE